MILTPRWSFFRHLFESAPAFEPEDPANMGTTLALDSIMSPAVDSPGKSEQQGDAAVDDPKLTPLTRRRRAGVDPAA